jgi:hypothetical protein
MTAPQKILTDYPPAIPCTRKQLAWMYDVSPRQFRNWVADAGIALGKCHTLPPSKVKLVFEAFGVPVRSLDVPITLPRRKEKPL